MRSIEYDENHPPTREELIRALFQDENDPRSPAYRRALSRPRVNVKGLLLFLLIWAAAACAAALAARFAGAGVPAALLASAGASALLFAVCAKRIVVFAVRLYQRFAPDEIRCRCRFEPSCSEYMLLAIEKYGLPRGVKKGIGRLRRCNVNGGGFDMP